MSTLLVHPLVLRIKFFYEHFFSGFSESGVKISDFFYNSDLHMKDLVASQVEVVASCLIQMVIGNISFMF